MRFISSLLCMSGVCLSCLEGHATPLPNQGLEASAYTNNSSKQEEWALDFFRTSYIMTGNEKKILDLGSGDGSITIKIAKMFADQFPKSAAEFIGMDISQSMIEKAKADYPKENYKNISFVEGSAEKIPYKDFDLIVSFSTLHFAMEQEKAIQELYNSLAPGGTVLILVPSKNTKNMNPLAGSLMTSPKWKTYFPKGYTPSRVYFTLEQYEKMLRAAGFASVDIKLISREDIYPSENKFIDSLVAVLNYVPADIRREFAVDLANLLNTSQDSFGAIHYSHGSFQINAKKQGKGSDLQFVDQKCKESKDLQFVDQKSKGSDLYQGVRPALIYNSINCKAFSLILSIIFRGKGSLIYNSINCKAFSLILSIIFRV